MSNHSIDYEEMKEELRQLKNEIESDQLKNFWKYYGEKINRHMQPKLMEIISTEFTNRHEGMKLDIAAYILANTKELKELPE